MVFLFFKAKIFYKWSNMNLHIHLTGIYVQRNITIHMLKLKQLIVPKKRSPTIQITNDRPVYNVIDQWYNVYCTIIGP